MLGAAALTSLSAMRAGAGLVTLGIPQSLNLIAQRKISSTVMTWPLPETKEQSLSLDAYGEIKKDSYRYSVVALGPGLSQNSSTEKLILKIISSLDTPLVLDADALNALSTNPLILKKTKSIKILTPHSGEMSRLIKRPVNFIENNRAAVARKIAQEYNCILVLKGHRTVVASPSPKVYVNKTGNAGMATAGSGDVLTGIISAFLAQGIDPFEAAKTAVFIHGKAGDIAALHKGKTSLIATDIIESLPLALKNA
jgi:NAD(P)H-hydrate epimerase